MNEPDDSKQSMEGTLVEAIGVHALGVAPVVPSDFKVRGHDCVTLCHDLVAERNGPRNGNGRVRLTAGVGRKWVSRDRG